MLKLFNHEFRQMTRKNRFTNEQSGGFTSDLFGGATGPGQTGAGKAALADLLRDKIDLGSRQLRPSE
jgi:hypothetical protein